MVSYQPAISALPRAPYLNPILPIKRKPLIVVALTKRAERFISSLADTASAADVSSSKRLINKFVTSSSKSVALDALSHLLSPRYRHLSSLALPLYSKITETAWYEWNPKLLALLAALLDDQGLTSESEALIFDAIARLRRSRSERDLSLFLCHLVESHSGHASARGFDKSYARLSQLVRDSSSMYVKRQGYKSMVKGLSEMGRPREAEGLLAVIEEEGVGPSVFEFRCVLYGYGKLGFLEDMERLFKSMGEAKGFGFDTVSFNMMLGCYGAHKAVTRTVAWVRRMKELGVPLSLRTCNAVLNSCPTIMGLLAGVYQYPVEMGGLVEMLGAAEAQAEAVLVAELAGPALGLEGVIEWDECEGKLDLHGMHLGTAYVVVLEWMQDLRRWFGGGGGKVVVPAEITVVCGLGNHSNVRGESPVRRLVKEIMIRTRIPMRVDRKNRGCFVAKGKVVEEWIRTL